MKSFHLRLHCYTLHDMLPVEPTLDTCSVSSGTYTATRTATHCNTLHHTATRYCNDTRHSLWVARFMYCNTHYYALHHTTSHATTYCNNPRHRDQTPLLLQCVLQYMYHATHNECRVLLQYLIEYVAVCCSALQYVTMHCSVLQCIAVRVAVYIRPTIAEGVTQNLEIISKTSPANHNFLDGIYGQYQ